MSSSVMLRKDLLAKLLVAFFLALPATGAMAQQTEAEKAAQSQRQLTKQEEARRKAGCSLPRPHGDIRISGREYKVVSLPAITMLSLITLPKNHMARQKPGQVIKKPDLPFGGIGPRDICFGTVLYPLSAKALGGRRHIALALRRGLDLAADYPSSAGQIRKERQLARIAAGKYIIQATKVKSAPEAADRLWEFVNSFKGTPEIRKGGVAFWAHGFLFIPLADGM